MEVDKRYRVVRLLARDGLAESYEALLVTREGGRPVVLRRVLSEHAGEGHLLSAFLDAAPSVARVEHAGLAELLDYGLADGLPFFAEAASEGLDLDALLDRAKAVGALAPPEAALDLTIQVALALFHVHQARGPDGKAMGLCHGEVRPKSVILSWTGHAALAGLGVARLRQRLEAAGALAEGTRPGRQAPEQHLGEVADPRTDIFGLGLLLHEALTGRSPIIDPAEGRIDVMPVGHPGIARILDRALRLPREERYRSAVELAEEAGAWLVSYAPGDPRVSSREWLASLRPTETDSDGPRRTVLFELSPGVASETDVLHGLPQFQAQAPSDKVDSGSGRLVIPVLLPDPSPVALLPAVAGGGMPAPAEEAPRDELLGTLLHGYRLVERIGQGSVARVYRAAHQSLPRECAVKVLDPRQELYPLSALRLEREAQALAAMDHPNLVKVLDFGKTPEGSPFLMLELLRGETLRSYLEAHAGPRPLDEVRDLIRQVATGLSVAHEAGLIHRDLKPSNLMLVQDGPRRLVKILDFGLARMTSPATGSATLTQPRSFLGTPKYIAPEQIVSASDTGPRADLYALGVILHQLLRGAAPFDGTVAEVINAQLNLEPPELPPSGGLEALAKELMAKSPSERLGSAKEVLAWLDQLEAPEIVAEPIRLSEEKLLRSPRRLVLVLALLIAAALLLGTAVAALTAPDRPAGIEQKSSLD